MKRTGPTTVDVWLLHGGRSRRIKKALTPEYAERYVSRLFMQYMFLDNRTRLMFSEQFGADL